MQKRSVRVGDPLVIMRAPNSRYSSLYVYSYEVHWQLRAIKALRCRLSFSLATIRREKVLSSIMCWVGMSKRQVSLRPMMVRVGAPFCDQLL